MTLYAKIGQATALDGREAGTQAVHNALREFEGRAVDLALIFASHEYNVQKVVGGITGALGDTPLLGFSTSAEFSSLGRERRSVVVALLAGDDLKARSAWVPGFTDNTLRTAEQIIQTLEMRPNESGLLLVVGDGLNGDGDVLSKSFMAGNFQLAGCMADGNLRQERTYQIGGSMAGSGGLAAAILSGRGLAMGVGMGHGWQSVGAYFKITQVRGQWVRFLDGKPASESYATLFGHSAAEWSFPPLSTMVRLYPLGIEQEGHEGLQVRAPLRVEADGSLRMNTVIPNGTIGHLLVGSKNACLDAARQATKQALAALGDAKPRLALIFADISWDMLLKGNPGAEVEAVRQVLGQNVPVAGGYTLGQIGMENGSQTPQFLNQHIEVIVFGEK